MKNKSVVGIVTFHNAHNYGAVLQAYGLKRKLELMGFESEFIQDENDSVGKKYSLYPSLKNKSLVSYLKSWVRLVIDFRIRKLRHDGFDGFIKKYLPVYSLSSGKRNYSSVVLGSDQIWNFDITKGMQNIYFGIDNNIVTDNVFSYAASMGKGMTKDNFTENFKKKLCKLNHIGVREKSLGEIIKSEFNIDYTLNLDPTLLLGKSEWDRLTINDINQDKYILVYEVEKNINTESVVNFMADKLGLKVKVISSKLNKSSDPKDISTASPEEFLSLFKNATFVVTTSFHGTVFSIINEVPFFTIKFNNGIDLRSSGLLSSVGLESRHINSISDIQLIDIDYSLVTIKLNEMRSTSENYLYNALRS
ncbi:polysaccharide pyruvyl transferase family protein [Vibrio fluvialis]|uniref:polysaccharide pyruvyl transferase family protein n=1 Tax=Vibrio fluvialis TaxID=676 RepID=UPI001F31DAA9|nr:polysaccharide pyruvyl transferase family protein [Vibrio fluvialis]MCE7650700.1 polysaccharide pyruvyl transferase family protein [Vibrio fluvialis]